MGHQANGARHAEAVLLELSEIGIAVLGQIHALALDHLEIGLQWLGVVLDHIGHHPIESIAHLASKELAGALLPGIQTGAEFSHRQGLGLGAVHQLIGAPAPHVNRPNRPPLGRRHQQRA